MSHHTNVTPEQHTLVTNWLHAFERALAEQDGSGLKDLWLADCHWRDVLAMHWEIDTISGRDRVCTEMLHRAKQVNPRNWSVENGNLQALSISHAHDGALLVLLRFETDIGPGEAVLRLMSDPSAQHTLKAWSLMTSLVEIRGHEEKYKKRLETRDKFSRSFSGPTGWKSVKKRPALRTTTPPC